MAFFASFNLTPTPTERCKMDSQSIVRRMSTCTSALPSASGACCTRLKRDSVAPRNGGRHELRKRPFNTYAKNACFDLGQVEIGEGCRNLRRVVLRSPRARDFFVSPK